MFLKVSIVLFGLFFLHVAIGSFNGPQFLNDVGEMLLLLMTSIAFVAAILQKEAEEKSKQYNL